MKKYFAKYLPVEGEIKEGDICNFEPFGFGTAKIVYKELCFVSLPVAGKGSLTSPISRNLDDKRPYKLFLCTRDIQVGDKVNVWDGEEWFIDDIVEEIYPNSTISTVNKNSPLNKGYSANFSYENVYKVVGEISPEAIWVKEGDEFEEEEWLLTGKIPTGKRMPDSIITLDKKYIGAKNSFITVKGPCGHFH